MNIFGIIVSCLMLGTIGYCTVAMKNESNKRSIQQEECQKQHKGTPYKEEKIHAVTTEGCVIKALYDCDSHCYCYKSVYYTTCPSVDLNWSIKTGKNSYRDLNNLNLK
jgi:hypothetical protein